MSRVNSFVVAVAVCGAALYAAWPKASADPAPRVNAEAPLAQPTSGELPPGHPPPTSNELPPGHPPPPSNELPPGHPPVAGGPAELATGNAPAAASSELVWDAPKTWQSVPNPSPMRIATYKIPRAAGDAEDAELSITAAAGGVDANIKRWSGQFGDAMPKTEARSPRGLKVTVVELRGTFASGGMMGGPSTPKEKFMLLAAIVDGGERQHFFKMTGPEKTVLAAKKDFDAFVGSLRPS